MKWQIVDFTNMNNDEIYNIVKKLRESNNNPVSVNGKIYKFDKSTLLYLVDESNNFSDNEVESQEINPKKPIITRKTILMAKVLNANNLASIFEGNFYPIVKWEGDYITVKDDNGNQYVIRKNRIKEIEVYQEKPE